MKLMRNLLVAVLLALGVAVLHADLWSDLGTQEADARRAAVDTVLQGSVPSLGAQAFKRAAPAVRVALVQRAAAWAKTFIQSPAFKTMYDAARGDARPQPPEASGSYGDQLKKQREEFAKNAAEMRKNVAGQPKEMRDAVETAIAQAQAQLDALSKNPEYMKTMEAATTQAAANDKATYAAELQKFDREHPASVPSAVALRLRRFLDVCGAVDFNAKLVSQNGAMVFANPAYEQKPADWKMCFRAGREPVEAAKAFALAWLKELGG